MISHQKYMHLHVSVMLCPRDPLGGNNAYVHNLMLVNCGL
jgi:hypothetical protein